MRLEELDYILPAESIAQRPLTQRDASRLLVLDRSSTGVKDRQFCELAQLLRGNELLVFNNARVIPARLFGRKMTPKEGGIHPNSEPDRGASKIEVFLAKALGGDLWEALVKPGRKIQIGDVIAFGKGAFSCLITAKGERGLRTIRFTSLELRPIHELLEKFGHVPLPPYIDRQDEISDRERYQTVFAKNPGAVAAPTAGLHFSEEILKAIRLKGVDICELTLHVGLGTFQPVRVGNLEDHLMHGESYEISVETAEKINEANASGRPIVAVGTTVVRALEDSAQRAREKGGQNLVIAGTAEARLFITPGFQFRVVNQLLTNFHLPKSTLLALVCAFAGHAPVLSAYKHAVGRGYRFYSYGDCMFIR
jgi:S-adenosylmethionine:tRNA ribosyltransferase-isomerase